MRGLAVAEPPYPVRHSARLEALLEMFASDVAGAATGGAVQSLMVSRQVIFWDVDTQADFMLPGGRLYVPGAENLIPI